jgi:lysozyme
MVQVPINSNQFSALVSFVYNVGDGNFASSTLLKALNKWLYSEVPNQLKRWKFGSDPVTGKKIELPGLVKRRQMEADLWNDGL